MNVVIENNKAAPPTLSIIVDRLRITVDRYEASVLETTNKLNTIQVFKDATVPKNGVDVIPPDCIAETIFSLLDQLQELNGQAERNLTHLNQIV